MLRLGVGIAVLWTFGAAHIEHHWNELGTSERFLSFIFVIAIQPLLAVLSKRSARRICETPVPWSTVRARRRKRKQLEKAKQTLSSGRIFGRAGEGLSEAIELFGEERVAAGVVGEQTTVYQLAAGLELIGADYWLFNSLSVPSLRSADVDHALVVDEDVYLIDSKKWAPGFYTMIDGVVVGTYFLESGPRRFVSRSIMSEAVEAYRKYLNRSAGVQEYENPRLHTRNISSYIIAHPSNPDEPFGVENIKGHDPQLVTLSDFFLFGLRDRNSEGPHVIDGYRLLSLMKNSPRSSSRNS
ncbi:hypothetical protein [Brachybacterium sp. p3-SID957]|uniref:hypothetical protein n=1 Tax=Brachybacterium sp. p3-SID957 TaxID=2916049 RepID=UPI00223BBC6C|nr:hypothetical protein [Brachybacterium sp. p3-SID957]MCT1777221.1 hypothetical protein [Brachybacterium sp. p3-SID957]